MSQPRRQTTTYGFTRAAGLMQSGIRAASQSRGFAVSRLLTHWNEVVGEQIASVSRPVEVTFGRQGIGATLHLLTTGAQAPMLEMQKEKIVEKVNACYGYRAVHRVRITQTAPTGFAEGQAVFSPAPRRPAPQPDPEIGAAARDLASGVDSDDLRKALEALGTNVLAKRKRGP